MACLCGSAYLILTPIHALCIISVVNALGIPYRSNLSDLNLIVMIWSNMTWNCGLGLILAIVRVQRVLPNSLHSRPPRWFFYTASQIDVLCCGIQAHPTCNPSIVKDWRWTVFQWRWLNVRHISRENYFFFSASPSIVIVSISMFFLLTDAAFIVLRQFNWHTVWIPKFIMWLSLIWTKAVPQSSDSFQGDILLRRKFWLGLLTSKSLSCKDE